MVAVQDGAKKCGQKRKAVEALRVKPRKMPGRLMWPKALDANSNGLAANGEHTSAIDSRGTLRIGNAPMQLLVPLHDVDH